MKDFLVHRQIQLVSALIAGSVLLATAASAQQYVYPAKGQSADKQKKDEYECHQWAVNQTGFDPTKAPPPAAAAPPPTTGASRGSGARGAARGAVVGEIVQGAVATGMNLGQRSRARKSDHLPADPVSVAAVNRIGQKSLSRVGDQ